MDVPPAVSHCQVLTLSTRCLNSPLIPYLTQRQAMGPNYRLGIGVSWGQMESISALAIGSGRIDVEW